MKRRLWQRVALSILLTALAGGSFSGQAGRAAATNLPVVAYWHLDRLVTEPNGHQYMPDVTDNPALRAYVQYAGGGGRLMMTDDRPQGSSAQGSANFVPKGCEVGACDPQV